MVDELSSRGDPFDEVDTNAVGKLMGSRLGGSSTVGCALGVCGFCGFKNLVFQSVGASPPPQKKYTAPKRFGDPIAVREPSLWFGVLRVPCS